MARFDTERFILEVKLRPAIWDTRCDEYYNKLTNRNGWDELCNLFVKDFNEMDWEKKLVAGGHLLRKWTNLSDRYIREAAKLGAAAETGKKKYIYFKQLSFLAPIIQTKPIESLQELKKREREEEEEKRILQAIAKNMERKASEDPDPDKQLFLGLLPFYKSLPQDAKIKVLSDIVNSLSRYTQAFIPMQTSSPNMQLGYFGGPASSGSDVPNYIPSPPSTDSTNTQETFNVNIKHSYTTFQPALEYAGSPQSTQSQVAQINSPSPGAGSSSSICDDYFS